MSDTLTTKKVTELSENTDVSDNDLFMAGSAGTASLRKIKWSTIWNKIKTKILSNLVVNNLTATEEGYMLDARQGKELDRKISELNTKINNTKILVNNRTTGAWIAQAYTPYNICEYTIQSEGIYLAVARMQIGECKTNRSYRFELLQNQAGNGTVSVELGTGGYDLITVLSYIFTCNVGDKIYTTAQSNYVASDEQYAGLGYGFLQLIKLPS